MQNLFQISEEMHQLMKEFNIAMSEGEDLTDEQVENLQQRMEQLSDNMHKKADGICHYIRQYGAFIEHIKSEKKRLNDLQKSYESKSNNLKKFLKFIMDRQGLPVIETDENRISIRNTTNGKIIEGKEHYLPENLKQQSLTIKDDQFINDLLEVYPDAKDFIEEKPVSNTDIKKFLQTLEENVELEQDGNYFVRKENKLFYIDDENLVEICEIVDTSTLQIK